MQRTTALERQPIGTVDGEAGDGFQRGACKVDVGVAGPRADPEDGSQFVEVSLTARYPGRPDQTVRAELPAFAAERLSEALVAGLDQSG